MIQILLGKLLIVTHAQMCNILKPILVPKKIIIITQQCRFVAQKQVSIKSEVFTKSPSIKFFQKNC